MANKFSDEQLLQFKRAGFSAEEIALFEFNPKYAPTAEELDALIATKSIADTLAILPDNKEQLLKTIKSVYGIAFEKSKTPEELEKNIKILAEKNPELARQTAAMFMLTDYAEK